MLQSYSQPWAALVSPGQPWPIFTWPCLKLNLPRHPFGAPAAPRAQSECIACFACTFSIGTPHASGPRGCFKGSVQTMNTWPCPKLDLPSPSASLASLTPSLLEHHARPVRGVVSRANFEPSEFCTLLKRRKNS